MTAPTAVPVTSAAPAFAADPTATALATDERRALREALGDAAILAGDPAFETGRLANNLLFDRRPAAIVRPADPLGVSRAVRAAREIGLDIAVRGGGHSLAGHSTSDGGLLIDLGAMREVAIDPVRWTGTAQGGATAGDYTQAAARHGFATPFGDSASVGLGGLTLGGGIGWLARKHGMTIDNLLAVDLVDAEGHLRTVTEASDPELFWALRGGGGNFGIATRFEYRLHPVSMVTGGALVLPLDAAVLRGVVEASQEAPEELTSITSVMGLPPAPFVPRELVGTPVIMVLPVHAGDPEAGARALAPLRSLATPLMDMTGPMPFVKMYDLTAGGAQPAPTVIRSSFLGGFDQAAAEAVVTHHRSPEGAATMTQLRVLGGAMGRVPAGATAFAHRDAPVMAAFMGMVTESVEQTQASLDALLGEVGGAGAGAYANFLGDEGDARVRDAYPAATRERLVAVKRRLDPANVFRANHNIRP